MKGKMDRSTKAVAINEEQKCVCVGGGIGGKTNGERTNERMKSYA
jgi:hypothetical protein